MQNLFEAVKSNAALAVDAIIADFTQHTEPEADAIYNGE